MITTTYQTERGWSVADRGGWLPGIYDSAKTARAAARFDEAQLLRLAHVWRHDGEDRPATMADLATLGEEPAPDRAAVVEGMSLHPIIAFVRARLAEDEERAERSAFGWGGRWSTSRETDEGVEWYAVAADGSRHVLTTEDQDCAAHAALHDPARVLAQVAAMRAVLDLHAPRAGRCQTCATRWDRNWIRPPAPCPTLVALAAAWADHPDYPDDVATRRQETT